MSTQSIIRSDMISVVPPGLKKLFGVCRPDPGINPGVPDPHKTKPESRRDD